MAFCTSCGNEISDQALACPNCGQRTDAPVTRLEYADFWTRVGGAIIDWIVVGVAGFLLGRSANAWFLSFILGFLYHWLLVAYWDGQTVGKRVVNIRVTRRDGTAVDNGTAAGRAAMRIVSGIPLGLGFLWAAWDQERRTWHDMVADTRVYRIR